MSSGAVPQSQQSSTLSALQAIVTTSPSLNDPTQVANLLSVVGTQPTTAYDQFQKKTDGTVKVVFKPSMV